MTRLAAELPPLAELNRGALRDPRVTVVNQDAFVWLAEDPGARGWNAVIIDFPDPNTFALGKLFAVNARFGNPDPATAEYWITRLPSRP